MQASRLNVLISAYACSPSRGSEPGQGWNVALQMARYHDVWLLTRANNRPAIEAALAQQHACSFRCVYYDLPRWARWWKRGGRGIRLYYYLWQLGAWAVARRLNRTIAFDVVHHVTFGRYWAPSFVSLLSAPFVWGPVGGGESTPRAFLQGMGARGRAYEAVRSAAQWVAELDPFLRLTARRSCRALATTPETAMQLRRLGCRAVDVLGAVGVTEQDAAELQRQPGVNHDALRFLSIGRLLPWKGFHLGLQAFARAEMSGAEFWIIGDGPDRRRLEALVQQLGVAAQVRFLGVLPRTETLARLGECRALVHPSLHDSGGWVCLEAMLAELPVLCLDHGGPATLVTRDTGFLANAQSPDLAVRDLAAAMAELAHRPDRARAMGKAARARMLTEYPWSYKGEQLDAVYRDVVASANAAHHVPSQN